MHNTNYGNTPWRAYWQPEKNIVTQKLDTDGDTGFGILSISGDDVVRRLIEPMSPPRCGKETDRANESTKMW